MDEASGSESKLLSLKEALRPSVVRSRVRLWNWHRLIVSFWGCVSFVGLGTSLIVFGPTLLDIASHLSVGVGILAVMFTCRALGSGIGSVSSGVIMDKYSSLSYTILSVVTFSCIATTALLPLSIHVAMLGVFMFFNGVATGSLENGVHAVLMRLWGSKSGPCMQVLHFSWSFGAFVAPLIAKQFIREVAEKTDFNGTCSDLWTNINSSTSTTCSGLVATPTVMDECFLQFTEVCENVTDINSEDFSYTDMNCTTATSDMDPSTEFRYAYFIAASLFLPALIAFIYYSIRQECIGRCCSKLKVARRKSAHVLKNIDALTSEKEINRHPLSYTIVLFTLLFSFMFLYVGLEAGFGSLIFTVAVKGQLCFAKDTAAVLQSVFWGTFCFMRMFSVIFAILQVRASIMIGGNLFGSFVASLIMIFYIDNATAIWIGSAVLGMSYASIFPTVMTWMSENAKATGKATAVLVTAGTVGDITLPAVMGAIVAQVSPESLFYFTFVGVIISAGTAAIMFLTACLQKQRQSSVRGHKVVVKYKHIDVDNESLGPDNASEKNIANGTVTVQVDISD